MPDDCEPSSQCVLLSSSFIPVKRSANDRAGLIFCNALIGYATGRDCDQVLETIMLRDTHCP